MQNMKKRRFGICVILLLIVAVFAAIPGKRAQAAETKRLMSITAVYTGDAVLVGHSIDLEKLTVMGLYSDGSYVSVKDYALSTYIIQSVGNNVIQIKSEGVSGVFTVQGKKVLTVTAYYSTATVTVGELLDREKLTVKAHFSNGTTSKVDDYLLSHNVVAIIGENEYTVTYESVSTKFTIIGKEEKRPVTLYAYYNGPTVIVGNSPKRDDFYVSVFFSDGTKERLTSFELTPSVIQKEGSNTVLVSYGEISSEVRITGKAKNVLSIKAEYVGLPVVVGKSVDVSDIKVTATYNDGTKDLVNNFTLSGSVIYKIGDNLINVFCGGRTAYINVRGVEAEIVDYSNNAQAVIRDGEAVSSVMLAVDAKADPKNVLIEKINANHVRKAIRRLVKTDKFIAFEVSFLDPELDVFLPMMMKLTVPAGYDKENFAVFYTPNRKTVMAQMNGEFLKDGTYEFKMFQPGTYIIADCTQLVYVESLELEEESLTLRVGRSYSLDPVILPHTATNKEVTYTSSRPQIATVSEYGTIKALKTGTTIITVETTDGSGKKCKLRVSVVEK